jgi:hypothetical protein
MLAALLSSLALAVSGAGTSVTPTCTPPPVVREDPLAHFIDARREFGFRHDRAYVRRLVRRDVWEYDVGEFPVTPRENRYLRLRDRLGFEPGIDRYLRAHPGLSGGISIEDDWPRGPYLLVRVTRRPAFHLRGLKRVARFPDNVRTIKVERSERELRRLQNRVSFRAHTADGFHVQGAGVDIDTGTVEIELITARTDHAAYFRARYGPHVRTTVIATELTRLECARLDGYRPSPDGRSLLLQWTTGGGAELERVEVVEHADRVEIGVVERVPNGARTLEARYMEHTVALSSPLAGRRVIDAALGRAVIPTDLCSPPWLGTDLDQATRERRQLGLPTDRALVRRMLRRSIPFTRREVRYLHEREQLAVVERRVDAYARRHRDVWGGTTIEGDFPRQPYVLVRFTRDRARHGARLKRLVAGDGRLRTATAERPAAELEALRARITRDARRGIIDPFAPGGGFRIEFMDLDFDAGEVVVEIVTRRPDHAAYFRERYGPLVRTVVLGQGECATQG